MRFKSGMITGMILGVIGAAATGFALSDSRTRKHMARSSRRAMDKAGVALSDLAGKIQ